MPILVIRSLRNEIVRFMQSSQTLPQQRLKLLIQFEVKRQCRNLRCKICLEHVLIFALIRLVVKGILDLYEQLPDFDEYILKHSLLRGFVDFLNEATLLVQAHPIVFVPQYVALLLLLILRLHIFEDLAYALWDWLLQTGTAVALTLVLAF